MEDAERHQALLQDHESYIRDLQREDGHGNTAGRVPVALNVDHPDTTWEDLGIDPTDPMVARHWTEKVTKKLHGLDTTRIMAEEAAKQRIRYSQINRA
ncbi:MAG: hypothetical protein ACAI44_21610 [Candidatus Sericytochromatia bacterium]